MSKTLVIGASIKPERYSYKAISLLKRYGHDVEAIGLKEGEVAGVKFKTGLPELEGVHTVTMYIGKNRQDRYYDYIPKLKPKRVIFNPGTENIDLFVKLKEQGIDVVEHCTLVMLNSGLF